MAAPGGRGGPSIFAPALDAIPRSRSADGQLLTDPFLKLCRLVLPVIDKFGSALVMVKGDIGGNIERLEKAYASKPPSYELLYDIVKAEVAQGTARGSSSNSNGLLWLTRAMDFLVALLRELRAHQEWSMAQVAREAYAERLKQYHGWIAQAAFTVALQLIPSRETFMDKLGGGPLEKDMDEFVKDFSPLLLDNHEFLRSVDLDDMKAA
eukprot:SM000007S20984  [mRNA]  locus=s7:1443886:1445407:+ [translate_table: standard]